MARKPLRDFIEKGPLVWYHLIQKQVRVFTSNCPLPFALTIPIPTPIPIPIPIPFSISQVMRGHDHLKKTRIHAEIHSRGVALYAAITGITESQTQRDPGSASSVSPERETSVVAPRMAMGTRGHHRQNSPRRSLTLPLISAGVKPWFSSWRLSGHLETRHVMRSLTKTKKRLRQRCVVRCLFSVFKKWIRVQ